MDELAKIFGSAARVKIMRLFLANDGEAFSIDRIVTRCRVDNSTVQKEVRLLLGAGFLKKTKAEEVVTKHYKATKTRKAYSRETTKMVVAYALDEAFTMIEPLRNLLVTTDSVDTRALSERLKKFKPKLLVLAGVFVSEHDRDIDLLLVADRLNKTDAEKSIAVIESEIGRELRYALFDTEEFLYRLKMFDKLLRDVFDYPHEKVVDKMKLSSY